MGFFDKIKSSVSEKREDEIDRRASAMKTSKKLSIDKRKKIKLRSRKRKKKGVRTARGREWIKDASVGNGGTSTAKHFFG